MIKTLEKLISGVFFLGGISKVLPDEYGSLIELFSLGGLGITSVYSAIKEYKTFINDEVQKCWARPLRIFTPIFKTLTVATFITLEIIKIQTGDEDEEHVNFIQGCYAGFAFALLMESRETWQMVRRRAAKVDQWDSVLSLLASGALIMAAVGKIENLENGVEIENISLMAAGGLCLLQTPLRFKKEYSKLRDDLNDAKNIEGFAVPELYRQPFLGRT